MNFINRYLQILFICFCLLKTGTIVAQKTTFFGEKICIDDNWLFQLGDASSGDYKYHLQDKDFYPFAKTGRNIGVNAVDFPDEDWEKVNLPHDWVIEFDFVNDNYLNSHGYKPVGQDYPKTSLGWYRKFIDLSEADRGKKISIQFDGVYRDCDVWINGFYLGNNQSGYMEFSYDITDFVNYSEPNLIVARVNATENEGWWYEGAGIYRHVWLIKNNPVHIPEHATYITADVKGSQSAVNIASKISNQDKTVANGVMKLNILDPNGKSVKTLMHSFSIKPYQLIDLQKTINISQPKLWSIEHPNLYKLVSSVEVNGKFVDEEITNFGIRTIVFDKDKGVILNGKQIKIKGVCMHQDHAGVGVALPDRLQYYRIEKLKEMGCNAYRSAHHPPTPEILDACDKLGMLVMDETRLLSSSKEYLNQFERMILRDRNHPSVMIWSIGNEEKKVQNIEKGKRIAQTLMRVQKELDPSRLSTYGGNNGNQYEGVNEVIDVRGFNYMNMNSEEEYTNIDEYRAKHPNQPLWGSEEASTLCTRGEYSFDRVKQYMSDYDKEENKQRFWNAGAEEWWTFYDDREWLAGAFIWTGFDYRGEPSPFSWPNVNSNFGVMDVCGFPKNNYYYYKAWWTNEDVLHIYPHWNWPAKVGEKINVWCQSNCESVELFLNGKSLGSKTMKKNGHLEWDVVYQPGTLEARGIKNGKTIIKKIETTGPAVQIVATADRTTIDADGKDVSVVNITVVDDKGREIATANNFISFKIEGEGKIIGVGNGDPTSHEPDVIKKGDYHRRLFNGKCQVIVQSNGKKGEIRFMAESDQLKRSEVIIKTK